METNFEDMHCCTSIHGTLTNIVTRRHKCFHCHMIESIGSKRICRFAYRNFAAKLVLIGLA